MGKRKFYKIAALVTTLSLAISLTAFAATQSAGKTQNNKKNHSNFKSQFDNLVKAGTITQAQEDAAIKLLIPTKDMAFEKGNKENKVNKEVKVKIENKQMEENKGMKVKLDALVTAGTITQAQEDAILKLETTKPGKGQINNGLKGLVTAGTITKEQEALILKLCKPFKDGNLKDGAFKNRELNNNGMKTKLDTLVTAGTITQAQEDAMITALTPPQK